MYSNREVQEVEKKCPAAGSFGVAQSPKSSRGGTVGMILSAGGIAREVFLFSRNYALRQQPTLPRADQPGSPGNSAHSSQVFWPVTGIEIAYHGQSNQIAIRL
jgi:hypothetical protein